MTHIFNIIPTSMESGSALLPFKEEVLVYSPWVYLHGKLETESCSFGGWDKFKWFGEPPTKDGVYECRVWLGTDATNVKILEATAWIWEAKFGEGRTKITGLVVLNHDLEGAEFAFQKWKEKSDFF